MKKLRQHATVKSISVIVLLLLAFFAIASVIGFNSFTEALLSQYSEGAFLTAETAAQAVDADRIDEYAKSGGTTAEYLECWNELDRLCNSSGATFIYVIRPDRVDYERISFLFSTIDHKSSYSKYEFGFVRKTTNDEYREKYRRLYELQSDRELVIRDRGYIETAPHITAMIGLKGSDGRVQAILCVQRQMDVLASARQKYLAKLLVTLIAIVVLVIVGESMFLHRTLLQPLKQISKETARFSAAGELPEKKLQDTIRNRDEIGQLAGSIDRMEEQIQDYVASITKITAEKERINTELNLATQIQASMLPHIVPAFPDRTEFDVLGSMDPAKEVGGDFFDYFLIDPDHLGMVIADVSGKGIPAALFMMASKIILQSVAMMGSSAGEILRKTNEAVCSNNEAEMFVTVWVGILEISTGKLTAANAGHEYPVLIRAGSDAELYKDKHGFVIGGMAGVKYREYELQLNPGDKIFLYTDGVPEATNGKQELFGTERMIAALNGVKDGNPEQVLGGVRRAVDEFVQEEEQFDDLTMLCLVYKGPETAGDAMDELTVKATAENITEVTAFIDERLDALECPVKTRREIDVAVDELFGNISRYAYAPDTGDATVRFAYEKETGMVSITFLDRGIPFDPLSREEPDTTLPAAERKIGGLGIFLVKKTMDSFEYQYENGMNTVTIRKRI